MRSKACCLLLLLLLVAWVTGACLQTRLLVLAAAEQMNLELLPFGGRLTVQEQLRDIMMYNWAKFCESSSLTYLKSAQRVIECQVLRCNFELSS